MISAVAVSVIICTRNRAPSLRRALQALQSLERSSSIELEIVVVDNASTDDTRATVLKYAHESAVPIRYVYEPRPGLSVARNRGVATASGSILLFTDDDCLPAPTWAIAAAAAAGAKPMQVIGGRVELCNAGDLPVTIKTSTSKDKLTSHERLFGFLLGCNMIIGREVFDRIGLFDVRLGAGTGLAAAEETDFVYRALKASIPVSYEPDLLVFHRHGRTKRAETDKLMRGYMIGTGAFAMKFLLLGDIDPTKNCWWQFCAAVRQWWSGQTGFLRVLIATFTLVGGIKFLCGPILRSAR